MVGVQYNWVDINRVGWDFIEASDQYHDQMPHDKTYCPFGPCPDTGDEWATKILEITLRLSGDVHEAIRLSVLEHGQNLQAAAIHYRGTESDIVDKILSLAAGYSGGGSTIPEENRIPGHDPQYDILGPSSDATAKYKFMPRFPDPVVTEPWLTPFEETLVFRNIGGLCTFADDLNSYVTTKSSPIFHTLLNKVELLIESDHDPDDGYHDQDGKVWIGPAAYAFRNAYIICAAMMNGLDITLCEIASIVSEGAQQLSAIEADLEQKLVAVLAPYSGNFSRPLDVSFFQPSGTGILTLSAVGIQCALPGIRQVIGTMLNQVNNGIFLPHVKQAEQARVRMATRLAGQAEILLDAINYYSTHTGNAGYAADQISGDDFILVQTNATRDQGYLDAYLRGLPSRTSDLKSVMTDLSTLGGLASGGGNVTGDVQDIKKLEEAASVAEGAKGFLNLAGDVLPLLATVGAVF